MTTPQEFIDKWKQSGGAELANSQSFLNELCDLLEVPHPDPTKAEEDENVYVFEKHVKFDNGDGTTSDGRIDLYRKGCFVLESKQGSEQKEEERLARPNVQRKIRSGTAKRGTRGWSQAMQRARQQARDYAQAIPVDHGWPPFLIVADVGYCFDLYADFTQTGKAYKPFPDPQNYRIRLEELTDEDVRVNRAEGPASSQPRAQRSEALGIDTIYKRQPQRGGLNPTRTVRPIRFHGVHITIGTRLGTKLSDDVSLGFQCIV